tara:strand:- start:194 stop:535 length:342 start_codon:yes stop_codon:yes gene_type:complete
MTVTLINRDQTSAWLNDQMDAEKPETSVFSGGDRPISIGFQMARFMINWSAPDPTSKEHTEAIVNYIKGGKSMDEFAGFTVLAPQIHPQPGRGVLLVEADNLAAVQKQTYPWI